jgi:hypothetical protein
MAHSTDGVLKVDPIPWLSMVEHTRTLGFRVAFALGLGTMIDAGIFSFSGTAVVRIG